MPMVVGIHFADLHAGLDGVHGIKTPVGFPVLIWKLSCTRCRTNSEGSVHWVAGFQEDFIRLDLKMLVEQGETKTVEFAMPGENLAYLGKASFIVRSERWAVINIGEGIRDEIFHFATTKQNP
jgi:hypothetical protein